MRQIRLQDMQQIQKEAVIADLSKMENVSKQLLEQVEQIGAQRIALTPEEQKLFTLPQLQEINGVAGIQGTVMAKAGDRSSSPAVDPAAKSLDALVEKGNSLLEGQKYTEAIAVYEDVLRTDPKNASGFAGLAWAQLQTSKLEEAEITLKKALAYDANNPTSHYMLGVTLFRRERMNEAMASFEKSLELNGKNARARHYLGVITSKMGLAERAEREFKSSLAIDPSYADAHFNLAVLFITWDPPRWDDARKHYKDALEKGLKADPNIERLLNEAKSTTSSPKNSGPAVTTTTKGPGTGAKLTTP
jgi:tetratricopeptide (TPR) repeat protein